MIAHTNMRSHDITIELPFENRSIPMAESASINNRRPSEPRRSRRSSRRSTMGSVSSNSTGGGAISVESSDDAFAADLVALADLPQGDSALMRMSNTSRCNEILGRQLSGLTIDDDSADGNEPLVIKKVQSQLLDKHIKAGRISAVASSIDLRGGRSRNQLGDVAAGQRRARTTLSFGSNIGHLAIESQGTSMPRAMRRNDSWKLGERNGMMVSSKSTNKAAASAGRALLGR